MRWRMDATSLLGFACLFKPSADHFNGNDSDIAIEKGSSRHGCRHYQRKCKLRAPCCDDIFDCRHCHNEAKAMETDISNNHVIDRKNIMKVICSICEAEQDVQQTCQNCGVCMGEYFCGKCNFFDDDVSKEQFHCDACGICRVGGKDNFFHCDKCGCCYGIALQDNHVCVEKSMEQNCPICFEYLFDSLKPISVMHCGHTMHVHCFKQMQSHSQYSCPFCSKSVCNMSSVWRHLDQEVAATPMPEVYRNKMVWILCNDCGMIGKVVYHIVGHKCRKCKSYNTRQTKSPLNNSGS